MAAMISVFSDGCIGPVKAGYCRGTLRSGAARNGQIPSVSEGCGGGCLRLFL